MPVTATTDPPLAGALTAGPRTAGPRTAVPPTAVPTAVVGAASALLAVADDPDARALARHRLARVAAVDSPHLAPLRRVGEGPHGFRLTYNVPPGTLIWAELLQRHRPTAAEAVGMGLALCQALGALHGAGLAHGEVTAEQVLVAPDGTVLLTGVGGPVGTVAGDVAALAMLLQQALPPGSVDGALALLLVRACDSEVELRPPVSAIGRALERQCSPEPVRLPTGPADDEMAYDEMAYDGTADEPEVAGTALLETATPATTVHPASAPARAVSRAGSRVGSTATPAAIAGPPAAPRAARSSRGRRHRGAASGLTRWRPPRSLLRRAVPALLVVVGLVLIARATIELTGHGAPSTAHAIAVDSADWHAVVDDLDRARHAALVSGSAAALAIAVDPEGPAYARDLATLQARQQARLRLVGGEPALHEVTVVAVTPAAVTLTVTDTRAAYELREDTGEVVVREPARGPRVWQVVLTPDGAGWRIFDAVRSG